MALFVACGGGSSDDTDDATPTVVLDSGTPTAAAGETPTAAVSTTPASASPTATAAASPSAVAQGLADVSVDIASGPKAGEYSVTLVTTGGCSRGTFGPNTFGVAAVHIEGATGGFDGPQLTIFDLAGAAAGTTQFGMALAFDNYALNILMSPYEGFGSGTLTIDDRGDTATIRAEGILEDGNPATVEIVCHSVIRFG